MCMNIEKACNQHNPTQIIKNILFSYHCTYCLKWNANQCNKESLLFRRIPSFESWNCALRLSYGCRLFGRAYRSCQALLLYEFQVHKKLRLIYTYSLIISNYTRMCYMVVLQCLVLNRVKVDKWLIKITTFSIQTVKILQIMN